MKTKAPVLTAEERDVLLLVGSHLKYHSNSEIAQRLGLPVNRVKTLIHNACVKLKARNRNAVVYCALRQGEIRLDEVMSPDELADSLCGLAPDALSKIAQVIHQNTSYGIPLMNAKANLHIYRNEDSNLTKRERDVLIFAGQGLTSKEIAEKLCISVGAVRNKLNRACSKLGARSRGDAILLALKQRTIEISEVLPFEEILCYLALSNPESLQRMAQLLRTKLEQDHLIIAA